jgi:ABC-type phosphate/phosphonate transport system substrate-binding protein
MTAMLGMYDLPHLQAANDRFWTAIRSGLNTAPCALERSREFWDIWRDPDMVFSQTCGMPYRTALHGQVHLVGTPDYGLAGCPAGYYNSVLVARADAPGDSMADFAGQRFAYNEPVSQSGWAAPSTHAAKTGTRFGAYIQTGAHVASAKAVADGDADIAGIDALTWALICECEPWAQNLREVERTTPTPGLPYITSLANNPARIRAAVEQAIAALSAADRAALHLQALVVIPEETYLAVPTPPPPPA